MALPSIDSELVQIVDASFADAARRALKPNGDSWLSCRAGCAPCCHGVFRISALDAERLRNALHELGLIDSGRAETIRERAAHVVDKLRASFPGDPSSGVLEPEDTGRWDEFADLPEADGPCPVLDPVTGRCELYSGRPLTCRIFGPPVMQDEGIGVCELCYVGASEDEVLRGEMKLSHQELEEELDRQMPAGETVIAWALLQGTRGSLEAD